MQWDFARPRGEMEGEHAHSNGGVGADWVSGVDGLGRGSDVAGYDPGRCLAVESLVQAHRYESCARTEPRAFDPAESIQLLHDLQTPHSRFSEPARHDRDADSELISEH